MPTIDENISRFEQLLSSVQRDGIDKLMRYIKKNTDFYKAPASTRFHLACEGGLLQHSLNVYDCLTAKRESPIWKDVLKDIPAESFILIALAGESYLERCLKRHSSGELYIDCAAS